MGRILARFAHATAIRPIASYSAWQRKAFAARLSCSMLANQYMRVYLCSSTPVFDSAIVALRDSVKNARITPMGESGQIADYAVVSRGFGTFDPTFA